MKSLFVGKRKVIVISILVLCSIILIYFFLNKTELINKKDNMQKTEALNVKEVQDIQIYLDGILYGDVDLNGEITQNDLSIIRLQVEQGIMGNLETKEKKERADVDLDGKITSEDLALISKKINDNNTVFPAESITQKTITFGENIKLNAKTNPETTQPIVWTSSNSSVVNIDQTGKLTTMSKGESVITAAIGGMTKNIKIIVI